MAMREARVVNQMRKQVEVEMDRVATLVGDGKEAFVLSDGAQSNLRTDYMGVGACMPVVSHSANPAHIGALCLEESALRESPPVALPTWMLPSRRTRIGHSLGQDLRHSESPLPWPCPHGRCRH